MTALLNTLTWIGFTGARAPNRTSQDVSETEYQAVSAATAVLLAGGIAVTLTALSQAF